MLSKTKKPYVIYMAEIIYSYVSIIKNKHSNIETKDAINKFMETEEFKKLSNGKLHDDWFAELKKNKYLDLETGNKIPDHFFHTNASANAGEPSESLGSAPRNFGFDFHFTAYGSAAMILYNGNGAEDGASNASTYTSLIWSSNYRFGQATEGKVYKLEPYNIWDGATRWTKGMYVGDDAIQVVSFQIKKRVPIGKGGMILTDSKEAYDWFKYASYDGRNLREYYMDDKFALIGYHMYMTPEDAARGIILMDSVPEENEDTGGSTSYSDLSDRDVFKPYNKKEIGFKS